MDWPHRCCTPPRDAEAHCYSCARCGTSWRRITIAELDRKPPDQQVVGALDVPTTAWMSE